MKVTTETKKDERQLWLDSLKEGDEVAYRAGWGKGEYFIVKVTKRTPTGRIVCGRITWRKDGHVIDSGYSTPNGLTKVTEKIRDDVLKRKLVQQFQDLKWQHAKLDTLVAIDKLLKDSGDSQVAK